MASTFIFMPMTGAGQRRPGTWRQTPVLNNRLNANICCPDCSNVMNLEDHDITADGIVFPSIKCTEPHCSFRAFAVLKDW